MKPVWIKTSEQEPPIGKVVLGFWQTVVMETVIRHDEHWNKPGYSHSEKRNPPECWAEVPDLPDGFERGE